MNLQEVTELILIQQNKQVVNISSRIQTFSMVILLLVVAYIFITSRMGGATNAAQRDLCRNILGRIYNTLEKEQHSEGAPWGIDGGIESVSKILDITLHPDDRDSISESWYCVNPRFRKTDLGRADIYIMADSLVNPHIQDHPTVLVHILRGDGDVQTVLVTPTEYILWLTDMTKPIPIARRD